MRGRLVLAVPRVYGGQAASASAKEEELARATKQAKLIYSEMLIAVHSGETKTEPSSRKTLRTFAMNSLQRFPERLLAMSKPHTV